MARAFPASSKAGEQGFTLLGLMVAIAIINIGLGIAATSWVNLDRRAREAELIWRGRQYVRALQCHRAETGALPTELDELLDSDCIRALYPDPMSPTGEWRIIRQNDLESDARRQRSEQAAASALESIDRDLTSTAAFLQRSAGQPGSPRSAGPGAAGTQRSATQMSERFRDLRESLQRRFDNDNRIVGVVSASSGEAMRIYGGESTYDKWRFVIE